MDGGSILSNSTKKPNRSLVAYRQLVRYSLERSGFLTRENVDTPCGYIDVLGFKPAMTQIINRLKVMDRVVSTLSWKILFAIRSRKKTQKEISKETHIAPPYTRYLLKKLIQYSIIKPIKHSYHDIQYEILKFVPPVGMLAGFVVLDQPQDSYEEFLRTKPCVNELYICLPEKNFSPSITKKVDLFGVYTFDHRGNGIFRKPSTLLNDGNPIIYGQCDYIYFGRYGERIRKETKLVSNETNSQQTGSAEKLKP